MKKFGLEPKKSFGETLVDGTAEALITFHATENISPRIVMITVWPVNFFISTCLSTTVYFTLIKISFYVTPPSHDSPCPFLSQHHSELKIFMFSNSNGVHPEFINYKLCVSAANIKLVSINTINELHF